MLNIKELKSKIEFDQGLNQIPQKDRSFLQAYEYGLMQLDVGHKPIYLGVFEEENIVGALLLILFKAKRGTYLFCPYGVHSREQLEVLIPYLKKLGRKLKVDFLRFSPLMDENSENRALFESFGFRDAPVHMMHPELDWSLDITRDEKALLKGMRKNNRYGINKATKDGVTVKSGASQELLDLFYDMHLNTARRQKFVPWSKKFLDAQLKHFGPLDQFKVYLGYYEGKPIAGAAIMFYEKKAYYHHGASLSEFQRIPASYLLQWEAILEARSRGCQVYDFYGIVEDAPKHPWSGLSFFKKGFGGEARQIIHCQDLPLRVKYWLNWAIEKYRRFRRGY